MDNLLNLRFKKIVNDLLTSGKESKKASIAYNLRITSQVLTEILGNRMNPSIDVIVRLVIHYHVNPYWILCGYDPLYVFNNENLCNYLLNYYNAHLQSHPSSHLQEELSIAAEPILSYQNVQFLQIIEELRADIAKIKLKVN